QLRDNVVGVSSTQFALGPLAPATQTQPAAGARTTVAMSWRRPSWIKWAFAGSIALALAGGGWLAWKLAAYEPVRHGNRRQPAITPRPGRGVAPAEKFERAAPPGTR